MLSLSLGVYCPLVSVAMKGTVTMGGLNSADTELFSSAACILGRFLLKMREMGFIGSVECLASARGGDCVFQQRSMSGY